MVRGKSLTKDHKTSITAIQNFEESSGSVTFSRGEEFPTEDLVDVPFAYSPSGDKKLLIAKTYEFESSLQRMSTIVQDTATLQLAVHTKGSPEMVAKLCKSSTGTRISLAQQARTEYQNS